jgi:hypothetical protein
LPEKAGVLQVKRDADAYGQELMSHHRTGHGYEIVERDDGFIDISCATKVYFTPYAEWPKHIQDALRFVEGTVLDIGCGAGRHSLYLQETGHDVVGIDLSPLAVEICRERGLRRAENISITQITSRLGRFDTMIMLGNNFGLFANTHRASWLLRRFYNMTSRQGRIIAESRDPHVTDLPDHLAYHRLNRSKGRMPGQLRIRIRFRRHVGPWFDYLLVSKEELHTLIRDTGWHVGRFFDGKSGSYAVLLSKEG